MFTQQVTGSNGDCTGLLAIPVDAVAVAMNVTAVNPTAQSNLRVFPADITKAPTVSNLNFSAGQKPVPNKVDVKLSSDGKIKLLNFAGSVSVVGDVVGYYTDSTLKEIDARLAALEAAQPFAETDSGGAFTKLTSTAKVMTSLDVTAPVDGQVTVTSNTIIFGSDEGDAAICSITESTTVTEFVQRWESPGIPGKSAHLSGSRVFDIAADATGTYNLVCKRVGSGINTAVGNPTMTAIFTPAP